MASELTALVLRGALFAGLAGRCILALLAASAFGATLGVRAEQPATGPVYAIAMQLDEGGKRSTPRVLARAGETFAVATDACRAGTRASVASSCARARAVSNSVPLPAENRASTSRSVSRCSPALASATRSRSCWPRSSA